MQQKSLRCHWEVDLDEFTGTISNTAKMLTRYELADKSMGALRAVQTQTARMGDTIKRHTSHVAKHFEAKEKKHPVNKKLRARNRWQVGALPS